VSDSQRASKNLVEIQRAKIAIPQKCRETRNFTEAAWIEAFNILCSMI
jgi:hypothetical protein